MKPKNQIQNIKSLPKQLSFQLPEFNFVSKQTYPSSTLEKSSLQIQNIQIDTSFTTQDRENLKNAFRYICRLIFKEASRNRNKIFEFAEANGIKQQDYEKIMSLFDKAEQVSGERYFRKYIGKFENSEQRVICLYMIWFLENKYLRYISEQGKGKRKKMKKGLYIKFKNQVMLPYIESLL